MIVIPEKIKHRLIQTTKVVILTVFFTIVWVVLFYKEPLHTPTWDHHHHEEEATIESVREQIDTNDPASVEKTIQDLVESLLEEEHNVAALDVEERLTKICWLYTDICNKTVRDSSYSPQQRLFYQSIIVYVVSKIDIALTQWSVRNPWSLSDTLTYIKLFEENEGRRWSAWHTYIKLNTGKISQRSELREVLTHELWHVVDLWVISGKARQKNEAYTEFWRKQRSVDDPSINYYAFSRQSETARKAWSTRLDFVSWYAMKWVYEDKAESFNLYLNHYDVFKKLAQSNEVLNKKFNYFENLLGTTPLQYNTAIAKKYPVTQRERDTTKLTNAFY